MRRTWLPALLLGIVLLFGTYLRLADLGQGDFRVDELYQVFAAQGIARGEGPRLPSGELYLRGLDVTHLVRYSMQAFGPTEFAARLPSAIFGVLALVFFAGVLWAMAGGWVALFGTALFAVYPEVVEQSRSVRFYTYQLTLGVLAFYTGWRSLRESGHEQEPSRGLLIRQWGWAAVTLLLILTAARVQVVSLSVLVGWLSVVLVVAAADVAARGRGAWRRSMPLQLMAIVGMLTVLALVFRTDAVGSLARRARSVPFWVVEAEGGLTPLAYYYSLVATYPLLVGLLPLIFLAAILRRPRLGLYVTLWFAVPLFLHSFVLTWKGGRFVLVPMLGLFVAAAIAAAWGSGALFELIREKVRHLPLLRRWHEPASAVAVALILLVAFLTLPAFNQSRKMLRDKPSHWRVSGEIIRSRPELQGIPIGQMRPLHPLHYWGRIDFLVGRGRLAQSITRGSEDEWQIGWNPVGSLDRTARVPILPTPEAIQEHFAGSGAVLIGVREDGVRAGAVEAELVELLAREGEEICNGRCGSMRLFHWRFEQEDTVHDVSAAARLDDEASRRATRLDPAREPAAVRTVQERDGSKNGGGAQ